MSEQSINSFSELNSDSHGLNTQNTVMTDALNVTLTTKGEDQLLLQNMTGNELKTLITAGYTPIACKVYRDIAYIVSAKYSETGEFESGEIGTFPSPNWDALLPGMDPEIFVPLIQAYQPLRNFNVSYDDGDDTLNSDGAYTDPFRTPLLDFPDRMIELELQASYDGSLNLIISDDKNPIRLINSRFKLSEDGEYAAIADRRQSKDTNTYSNARFLGTRLFKASSKIVDLKFNGVITGGEHAGGSYRYYFKYTDSDGSLSDIIEESRTVVCAYDDHGAAPTENTGKAVSFTLSNLDRQYSGVKVFFSYSSGDVVDSAVYFELTNIFDLPLTSDDLTIVIYGDEDVNSIPRSSLNLVHNTIDKARSITQYDDRLLIANTANTTTNYEEFREISQLITISESTRSIEIKEIGSGYADPNNVYHNLGYWSGETYETAIVYILKDGAGLTPAFPTRGFDYLEGTNIYGNQDYTEDIIESDDGFILDSSENRLGAYRTKKTRNLLQGTSITPETSSGGEPSRAEVKFLSANIQVLLDSDLIQEKTEGYFFVRKKRREDVLMQGMFVNTAQIPAKQTMQESSWGAAENYDVADFKSSILRLKMNRWDNGHIGPHFPDLNLGVGTQGLKTIPTPGRIYEMTITDSQGGAVDPTNLNSVGQYLSMQGVVYPSPNDPVDQEGEMKLAFYSSDLLTDPFNGAALFDSKRFGVTVSEEPVVGFQRLNLLTAGNNLTADDTLYNFGTWARGGIDGPFYGAGLAFVAAEFSGFFPTASPTIMSGTVSGLLDTTYNSVFPQGNAMQAPTSQFTGTFEFDTTASTQQIICDISFQSLEYGTTNSPDPAVNMEATLTFHVSAFESGQDGYLWLSSDSGINNGDGVVLEWDQESKDNLPTGDASWFPNFYFGDINLTSVGGPNVSSVVWSPSTPSIPTTPEYSGLYEQQFQESVYDLSGGFDIFYNAVDVIDASLNDVSLAFINPIQEIVYDPIELSMGHNLITAGSDDSVEFQYINRGSDNTFGNKGFSALSDRNLYGVHAHFVQGNTWNVRNFAEDHVDYGDYVGVHLSSFDSVIGQALRNDTHLVQSAELSNTVLTDYTDLKSYANRIHIKGFRFGVMGNIYENPLGVMTSGEWKARYANTAYDESYFAISKRKSWADAAPEELLADGDCYINYSYKQAFYRQGIPGIETATDISVYIDAGFNQSGGLYDKGMVFPVINESNHNSALRTFQDFSDSEKALYNQNRKFFPLDDIKKIRSSRQNESLGFNFGYDHKSDKDYLKVDDRSPFLNVEYDTRVYATAPSVSGSFSNGYRDLTGLSHRDYQKNLGQIIKILSISNYVYMIQESGISILPINEKTQVSDANGGVFVKSATILAEKPYVMSSEYGSNQQFSVIKSDNYIYGYDLNKNKVWRVVGVKRPEVLSDFAVAAILNKYKDRMQNSPHEGVVITNFDRERNNVIFSLLSKDVGMNFNSDSYSESATDEFLSIDTPSGAVDVNDNSVVITVAGPQGVQTSEDGVSDAGTSISLVNPITTLSAESIGIAASQVETTEGEVYTKLTDNDQSSIYYNETLGRWVSQQSWDPLFTFNVGNKLYSFDAVKDQHNIWRHFSKNVPYCNFYGKQDEFYFEFVLVSNPTAQKILENLMVISNESYPTQIEYTVDSNFDFETGAESNASFEENLTPCVYHINLGAVTVITQDSQEYASGPFNSAEAERMKGGNFTFNGVTYLIGDHITTGNGEVGVAILNDLGEQLQTLPLGLAINSINFSIFKSNLQYVEDHLYLEVGKSNEQSLIRDKYIRLKLTYRGNDFTVIQSIVSLFSYSNS